MGQQLHPGTSQTVTGAVLGLMHCLLCLMAQSKVGVIVKLAEEQPLARRTELHAAVQFKLWNQMLHMIFCKAPVGEQMALLKHFGNGNEGAVLMTNLLFGLISNPTHWRIVQGISAPFASRWEAQRQTAIFHVQYNAEASSASVSLTQRWPVTKCCCVILSLCLLQFSRHDTG